MDKHSQATPCGLIEAVGELGTERYAELALQALGEYQGFNELRDKSTEEARELILQSQ